MASFSAADLQRRHALEGAPDPFPALNEAPVQGKSHHRKGAAAPLDTDSESAFPSLAAASPVAKQPANASPWSTASSRIKAPVPAPGFTDTFSLGLPTSGKDGKPIALGEVMKTVMAKSKVKVEASTQRKTGQTTFVLKGESEREIEKAKRNLIAMLSPEVTLKVEAPTSTIGSIIGIKGATLKQIRDQTSTQINIPPKDTLSPPNGTNGAHSPSRTPTPLVTGDEDEDEPTITITITGAAPMAHEARAMLNAIIASKTSKSTQNVRDIDAHVIPFLSVHKETFDAAKDTAEVSYTINEKDRCVTVSGDREGVIRIVEAVRNAVEQIKADLTSVKIALPKRQHRLLIGKGAADILEKSKCTVIVPRADETSDDVHVWGKSTDLPAGLAAVMEKANSQHTASFILPKPAHHILSYLTRISYAKTLTTAHAGIHVHTPPLSSDPEGSVSLDFMGEKAAVDSAVKQLKEFVAKLNGATRSVEIDWLVHRVLSNKFAKKIKQFQEAHNVLVLFPPEDAESSSVLLIYDPLGSTASNATAEKTKHLDEVQKDILKLAKDAADVKTETITIEKKWHDAILGTSGTTLNAIIGEEKALSIKVGALAKTGNDEDIVVRGPREDVDRAVKEIHRIVEVAKNDVIDNSYVVEFEIGRDYVGRIVGAHGAGVNKLRDQLGVKVDFADEGDDKEKDSKKRKSSAMQKSKVKITGRKENVEEAKKRVLGQVEKLADETSEVLKIPRQYHPALIGTSGKYVIRLEEKHSVKITFPRDAEESGESKTREALKLDEVLVKGGKRGVANAKAELLDAVEFEKESNNVIKFTVPSKAIARILGKGGAVINEIKERTDAQIDLDREESAAVANITLRGTKKAVAAAKAEITAIADSMEDEVTLTVKIESKFHRTLIGGGGQGLKDLVAKCGGPADSKAQAGLIHFPRQAEAADEVRLRGERSLVTKLKTELEKLVAELRDRVILGVAIPASQHRALIGRGGQHLTDLQDKTKAQIQFPGSRSYAQVGEPENKDELNEVDPADLVKVSGSRAACEQAIKAMKDVKPVAARRAPSPSEVLTLTVSIPLKGYHATTQNGKLLRDLKSDFGVTVEQSGAPQKPSKLVPPPPAETARIDDEPDTSNGGIKWQVVAHYDDVEEGASEWTLKAKDQDRLDKAQKVIQQAIEQAESATHVGFLTVPDRSVFPRIVGTKGSNVARLRAETGAEITVGRDDNVIVVVGSEAAIEAARVALVQVATPRTRSH